MKKLFVVVMVVLLLVGCASTLSIKNQDGSYMELKDYVVTETYDATGKVTSRTMVPVADIVSGMLTKVLDTVKSAMGMGTQTAGTFITK